MGGTSWTLRIDLPEPASGSALQLTALLEAQAKPEGITRGRSTLWVRVRDRGGGTGGDGAGPVGPAGRRLFGRGGDESLIRGEGAEGRGSHRPDPWPVVSGPRASASTPGPS